MCDERSAHRVLELTDISQENQLVEVVMTIELLNLEKDVIRDEEFILNTYEDLSRDEDTFTAIGDVIQRMHLSFPPHNQ